MTVTSPAVTPMKKIYAWLSDEERAALGEYCNKQGRSMYSVLKEACLRIIQGESSSPFSVAPKPDSTIVASSPALQAVPSALEDTVLNLKRRFDNFQKEFEKIRGNDFLWQEVTELKAGLGELNGKFSVLLLKLTKTEELENKLEDKIVETVAGVLDKLGVVKEGV